MAKWIIIFAAMLLDGILQKVNGDSTLRVDCRAREIFFKSRTYSCISVSESRKTYGHEANAGLGCDPNEMQLRDDSYYCYIANETIHSFRHRGDAEYKCAQLEIYLKDDNYYCYTVNNRLESYNSKADAELGCSLTELNSNNRVNYCYNDGERLRSYKSKNDAELECGPREIYLRDGRYYCHTVKETILNEVERHFGQEYRNKLHDRDAFLQFINQIEKYSFCQEQPLDLLLLTFPLDYEKYVSVGKFIQKLTSISPYCDFFSKSTGIWFTNQWLYNTIKGLKENGICGKYKQVMLEDIKTNDSIIIRIQGKVLVKYKYCPEIVIRRPKLNSHTLCQETGIYDPEC